MYRKGLTGLACVVIAGLSVSKAQVISRFTWDSNPVTTAVVGPNAISAGATATSSPGGVGGTNGLNPGAPNPAPDIDLTVPNTGSLFDVPNIDVSIDYRRNESTASMVRRGTFNFNTGNSVANFRVTYRVANGGTITTVTSAAVAIPSDNTFRNYRFTYDNCTGVGTMYVNSAVVWTSTPTPGFDLYWVGDGNLIIGQQMDGANNNIPNLDNFILQSYTCSTLPVALLDFSGKRCGSRNLLEWKTASEKNNAGFTILRSADGLNWTLMSEVATSGNSNSIGSEKTYRSFDQKPECAINYYKLVQYDYDGRNWESNIIAVDNSPEEMPGILKVTDVLGRDVGHDYHGIQIIFYADGIVEKRLHGDLE